MKPINCGPRAPALAHPPPDGAHTVVVEVDTAGQPMPPDQVMVHVYHWCPSGRYLYQGCVPLSDYAIEAPRNAGNPLPPAGEVF